jgi:hypothetical protein
VTRRYESVETAGALVAIGGIAMFLGVLERSPAAPR